jgi:hypothetical protein
VRCFGRGKELEVGRARFWGARKELCLGESTVQRQEHIANLRGIRSGMSHRQFCLCSSTLLEPPQGQRGLNMAGGLISLTFSRGGGRGGGRFAKKRKYTNLRAMVRTQ